MLELIAIFIGLCLVNGAIMGLFVWAVTKLGAKFPAGDEE